MIRGAQTTDEETLLLPASIDKEAAPAPAAATSAATSASSSALTSWIRLLLFFVASVIAGGIIPGQNEYNRLFCEAGVFRYACPTDYNSACCPAQWLLIANTMNSLSMFVTFLFLVSGIMFDIFGGRKCAVLGCAVLSVGFGILAVLLRLLLLLGGGATVKPSVETTLFSLGVLTCDIGSFLVNVGFYAFLFHLPNKQALILSLSNSCFSCASFIPIVISYFMDLMGCNLPSALLTYGAIILIGSGGVCWITVPSLEEYRANALVVLGMPIPKRSVKGWEGMKKQIRGAIRVLTHPDHIIFHKILVSVLVTGWLPAFVYMSMANPLGQEIFGEEGGGNGFSLGISFLKINTLIGLLVGPACGVLVDFFQHPSDGLIEVSILMAISLAGVAFLCGVANSMVQFVTLICVCVSQTLMLLFTTRYAGKRRSSCRLVLWWRVYSVTITHLFIILVVHSLQLFLLIQTV
jgi:hypothetical protein